jgi:hypothetical protein
MMENKPDECVMWRRYDRNGKEYYSVSITINGEKYGFQCFQNAKSKDTQPDFKSAPKRDVVQPGSPPIAPPKIIEPAKQDYQSNFDNSDLPF